MMTSLRLLNETNVISMTIGLLDQAIADLTEESQRMPDGLVRRRAAMQCASWAEAANQLRELKDYICSQE